MKNKTFLILPILVYEVIDGKKSITIGWLTKIFTFNLK